MARPWCCPGVIVALALLPGTARAHQMYLFAQVDGPAIRGEVYFRGRHPACDVAVTAFDPAGEVIGRAETDQQGKFRLAARFCCDHRLVADTGDGHGAEFIVKAALLPQDLPARGGTPETSPRPAGLPDVTPAANDGPPASPNAAQWASLRAEIAELRGQLQDHEQRTRFRDVLGGIGYILGIAGVAFYLLGIKKQKSLLGG